MSDLAGSTHQSINENYTYPMPSNQTLPLNVMDSGHDYSNLPYQVFPFCQASHTHPFCQATHSHPFCQTPHTHPHWQAQAYSHPPPGQAIFHSDTGPFDNNNAYGGGNTLL